MQLFLVTFFIAVLAQVYSQEVTSCRIWGDPHLTPFRRSAFDPAPNSYWCKTQEKIILLSNPSVEISVNVTAAPFWNEHYEMKFKKFFHPLCTITPTQNSCNDPSIVVSPARKGDGLEVVFWGVDPVRVIITTYTIDQGKKVHDIEIQENIDFVLFSQGLCIDMTDACELEASSIEAVKGDPKKAAAVQMCAEYMKEAQRTAGSFGLTTNIHSWTQAEIACINDVYTTSQPEWGRSAISMVLFDALKPIKFGRSTGALNIGTVMNAISEAAARARRTIRAKLAADNYTNLLSS